MRFFKRNKANHYSLPRVLLQTALAFIANTFLGYPLVLVFVYSHLFSAPVFILLATLGFAWIVSVCILQLRPAILRSERAIMGDEAFFKKHPLEFRKEVARWRKVSAFMNGLNDSDTELLPGLLQMKRDLSSEEAARLGIFSDKDPYSGKSLDEMEFACINYDRLYYSRHPHRLKLELRMLNIKRGLFLVFKNTDMPVSAYETRLVELRKELCA